MKNVGLLFAFVLLPLTGLSQQDRSIAPEIVEFRSAQSHLKGFLWKPPGAGPFPAVLFNHGSGGEHPNLTAGMQIEEAAEILAPFFIRHGYAFFYPFRRGQGPSAGQAPFMQDVLRREEELRGKGARDHLQLVLLTTEQIDDVMAALVFLKSVPGIDSGRIAVAGHSFGGQLTLLAAERDPSLHAAVTFAAAANSWEHSPELRELLLKRVRTTQAQVMFVHAGNDYSTSAGKDLAAEFERLHKPHVLKIYPAVGLTPEDGHNMLYLEIPAWENDVFTFLDKILKP